MHFLVVIGAVIAILISHAVRGLMNGERLLAWGIGFVIALSVLVVLLSFAAHIRSWLVCRC